MQRFFRNASVLMVMTLPLSLAGLAVSASAAEQSAPQSQIGKTTIGKTIIGPQPATTWSSPEEGKRYGQRIKQSDLNDRRERCSRRASAHGLDGLEHQKFVTACMFPW